MFWFFSGLFLASVAGILYSDLMPWLVIASFAAGGVIWWKKRSSHHYIPKSEAFKELQKIQKKRDKIATDKHHHINDQIDYIERHWGYTKEQQRTIDRFLQQRAYTQMYNRLSASLFPQLITLVDQCNQKEQKGCKREVSRRIKELTLIMKAELKHKKTESRESFETTLEVYDHLLKG
ncbi:MAG: hypothetical protein U9R26_04585 [Campylobacterota bacterium]|nr:hypothetical protein [Campylobacterota bacterium]